MAWFTVEAMLRRPTPSTIPYHQSTLGQRYCMRWGSLQRPFFYDRESRPHRIGAGKVISDLLASAFDLSGGFASLSAIHSVDQLSQTTKRFAIEVQDQPRHIRQLRLIDLAGKCRMLLDPPLNDDVRKSLIQAPRDSTPSVDDASSKPGHRRRIAGCDSSDRTATAHRRRLPRDL